MNKNEQSAGTNAEQKTKDEETTSSHSNSNTNVVRCLSWCIDRYCIANSFFQDRITFTKDIVHFSGKWSGYDKCFKGAIIKSCKSWIWKIVFYIFPKSLFQEIINSLFESITIKEYDYTPTSVQLIRNNGSGNKKLYHKNFNDGRFWYCITNREQVNIKRSRSWSVARCLNTLS